MSKLDEECLNENELKKMFKSQKSVVFMGELRVDLFRKKMSTKKAPPTVYRYMPFSRAMEWFTDKEIIFVNPELWEDPFEKRFLNGDYRNAKYKIKQLACLCVTTEHGENEAAAWRSFDKDGKHNLVQVTLDLGVLLKAVNDFAKKCGATVYVKAADYSFTSDQIKSSGKKIFLPDLLEIVYEDFINLMSIKRRAFAFEKEMRILIYGDKLPFDGNILKIPYKGKLIRTLKICPEPNPLEFIEADLVKEIVQKAMGKIRIEQSRLYDEPSHFRF